MLRLNLSCLLMLLLTFTVFSCTNVEYDIGRRAGVDKWINGVNYASSSANEANLFGQEGRGLATNPLTKPTDAVLEAYKNSLGPLTLSAEPPKFDVYINEIVEFRFRAVGEGDIGAANARLVIVLERAGGKQNNAQLIWPGDINGQQLISDRTTTYIAQSTSDGYVTIRLHTGTAFHAKDPMYYVNVWSANAKDPASVELNVHKPPQVGDTGLVKGDGSTVNDLTPPPASALGVSEAIDPVLSPNDVTNQHVFVKYTKRVGVTLLSKAGGSLQSDVPVANETVCWTLVGQGGVNDARIKDSDLGVLTGCGKTDDSGVYNVDFYSGAAYQAKYFLNFFHAKALPVSYEFNTTAMPKTLGEEGTRPGADLDGDGLSDDELKVDVPQSTVDPKTGKDVIAADKAQVLLEGLAAKDEVLKEILDEHCYDADKKFVCSLEKDSHGNWVLIGEDGKPVLADVDGDGLKEPVVIAIVKGEDGNDYFAGYDTDGDGSADTPPDPCFTYPDGVGCSDAKPATHEVWCRSNAKSEWQEKCGVTKVGIDELLDLEVRIQEVETKKVVGGAGIDWSIVKAFDPTNNAAFDAKGGPKSKKTTSDKTDGSSLAKFWTGTAYSSSYYIKVSTASSKAVYLPIATINMMGVPLSTGDHPSDSVLKPDGEAMTPPLDMPKPQAGLGNVKVEAEGTTTFSSPVVKTLLLNIKVVSEDGSKIIPNTQTYWKVTRGPSPNNNATLVSNRALTNGKGLGSNQFYTGTAFASLYYISVFHPNAAEPLIFTIKTDKYSGEGTGPSGDPSMPGDDSSTPCTKPCKDGDLDTIGGESTYSEYPQGIGCTEADLKCEKGEGVCKEIKAGEVPGCLLLTIEGDEARVANINSTERIKARLVWLNGTERVPVNGNILWTLDKGEGADGVLSSKRSATDASGYATAIFRTGSASNTKYRINAFFPNIHKDGKMIAHSVVVTTEYSVLVDSGTAQKNIIRASAKASGTLTEALGKKGQELGEIKYYLLSSDYHNCDSSFALQTAVKREESCLKKVSSADNKPICDNVGSLGAVTPIEIESTGEPFLLYAVASPKSGDVPLGFGCSPGNWFPSIPKGEEEAAERYLDIEVELEAVPMQIYGVYQSQSLLDLGGMLVEGTPIGDKLTTLANAYVEYFGADDNPGKQLVDYLKRYILFADIGGTDAVSCAKAFCGAENISNLAASCPEGSCNEGCKQRCVCYSFHCYTQQNKLGKLVTPLLTKLLEEMINKLIGKMTGGLGLQAKLCSVFDDIQFVELTGKTNFEKAAVAGQDDKIKGYVDFSGVNIPFVGSKDPGFTAIRGLWNDAYLVNGVDDVKIEHFTLNFNYGLFVYQMLSSFMPPDANGKFDLLNFIDCEKLFSKDINVPIIGSMGAEGLAALCKSFVGQATNKIFDLADSKYITLGITADGGARFGQGSGDCEPSDSKTGCKAMEISDGVWNGEGTMKGATYDIDGVWTGHRDSLSKAPQYRYGEQSIEEFKAERSVCMRKLRTAAAAANSKLDSNEACLLGSFDNPEGRSQNNACSDKRCYDNPSVVVCKVVDDKGVFDIKYAKADQKSIIKDANDACKPNPTDPGCIANPEVINGGLGVSNAQCITNCKLKGCMDNPTILVCDAEGAAIDTAKLKDVCGGTTLEDCAPKVVKACEGKCDTAACIMNSDSGCDSVTEAPTPVPDVLATWTLFNNGTSTGYIVDGKVNNVEFAKDIKLGLKADTKKAGLTSATLQFAGSGDPKFVTGSDGKFGAAGASKWTSTANQKWVIKAESTKCTHLEVTMKIYGDGRTIEVDASGISGGKKSLVIDQWTNVDIKMIPSAITLEVVVSSSSEPNGSSDSYKMLRIDDVVIKGVCTPAE